MEVTIQIHYIINDNKVLRRGSFPRKGKKNEVVALEFWKWIKKQYHYDCELEKVIAAGEDITDKVKELIEAPLE